MFIVSRLAQVADAINLRGDILSATLGIGTIKDIVVPEFSILPFLPFRRIGSLSGMGAISNHTGSAFRDAIERRSLSYWPEERHGFAGFRLTGP